MEFFNASRMYEEICMKLGEQRVEWKLEDMTSSCGPTAGPHHTLHRASEASQISGVISPVPRALWLPAGLVGRGERGGRRSASKCLLVPK